MLFQCKEDLRKAPAVCPKEVRLCCFIRDALHCEIHFTNQPEDCAAPHGRNTFLLHRWEFAVLWRTHKYLVRIDIQATRRTQCFSQCGMNHESSVN